MIIDLVKHKEYVFGAARILKDKNGNTVMHRMTEKLVDFYSYSEAAEIRAKCTAGIRIAFKSNTDFLYLQAVYGERARELFAIDILINNEILHSIGPEAYQENFSVELPDLGQTEKNIEIFLPHCCGVKIGKLMIADQATISPVAKSKTWLAIGDSITQGMTATTPLHTYTSLAARKLGYSLHNIAVGGAITQGILGSLANDIEWDVASVAFGTNDFNDSRPLDSVADETAKLLTELTQEKSKKVVVITTIPWAERTTPNTIGLSLKQYQDTIRAAASKFTAVTVIEGPDLIADDTSLFVDNVHPNNEGMQQYASNLSSYL